MSWLTPKTNWASFDGIQFSDLNRIEGNTKALLLYASNVIGLDMRSLAGEISIYPGACCDESAELLIELPNAMRKTKNSWAAGTDNGGLVGSAPGADYSWQYTFLIYNTTTGAVDVAIDDNPGGTNVLSVTGFSHKRRIGSIAAYASSFNGGHSVGNFFSPGGLREESFTVTSNLGENFTGHLLPAIPVQASMSADLYYDSALVPGLVPQCFLWASYSTVSAISLVLGDRQPLAMAFPSGLDFNARLALVPPGGVLLTLAVHGYVDERRLTL